RHSWFESWLGLRKPGFQTPTGCSSHLLRTTGGADRSVLTPGPGGGVCRLLYLRKWPPTRRIALGFPSRRAVCRVLPERLIVDERGYAGMSTRGPQSQRILTPPVQL